MFKTLNSFLFRYLLLNHGNKVLNSIKYFPDLTIKEAELVNINVSTIAYPVGINIKDNINTIKDICIKFKEKVKLDSSKEIKIFCTGESGTIIASFFSEELIKDYPYVKVINISKRGVKNHRELISGIKSSNTINIFVDDHIHSGNTLFQVYGKILKENKEGFIFDYVVVSNINRNPTIDIIKKSGIVKTLVFNQNI